MADILPFDTAESRRRTNQSAAARKNRKLIAGWTVHVEQRARAGKLKSVDVRVAQALTNFPSSVMHGYCWPKQKTLAETLNVPLRSLSRALDRLKRVGLLLIRQRGNRRSARYQFIVSGAAVITGTAPQMGKQTASSSATGGVASNATGGVADPTSSATSGREESYYSLESCDRESPPPPKDDFDDDYSFAEFWRHYPVEQWMSPHAAKRIYRRLSYEDRAPAVHAAGWYADDCSSKKRKPANAKTWLSDRAWEGWYVGLPKIPEDTLLLEPSSLPWAAVYAELTDRIGKDVASSWFGKVSFDEVDRRTACLSVPSKFIKSWIQTNYDSALRAALQAVLPDIVEYLLTVRR